MASRKLAAEVPAWRLTIQKWLYSKSYFPQLGMMRDDVREETDDLREAIRRLPKDVYDARNFRIIRALNLSNKKIVLPKEEWTKLEEDVMYLKPYLEEVLAEKKEKMLWNKK